MTTNNFFPVHLEHIRFKTSSIKKTFAFFAGLFKTDDKKIRDILDFTLLGYTNINRLRKDELNYALQQYDIIIHPKTNMPQPKISLGPTPGVEGFMEASVMIDISFSMLPKNATAYDYLYSLVIKNKLLRGLPIGNEKCFIEYIQQSAFALEKDKGSMHRFVFPVASGIAPINGKAPSIEFISEKSGDMPRNGIITLIAHKDKPLFISNIGCCGVNGVDIYGRKLPAKIYRGNLDAQRFEVCEQIIEVRDNGNYIYIALDNGHVYVDTVKSCVQYSSELVITRANHIALGGTTKLHETDIHITALEKSVASLHTDSCESVGLDCNTLSVEGSVGKKSIISAKGSVIVRESTNLDSNITTNDTATITNHKGKLSCKKAFIKNCEQGCYISAEEVIVDNCMGATIVAETVRIKFLHGRNHIRAKKIIIENIIENASDNRLSLLGTNKSNSKISAISAEITKVTTNIANIKKNIKNLEDYFKTHKRTIQELRIYITQCDDKKTAPDKTRKKYFDALIQKETLLEGYKNNLDELNLELKTLETGREEHLTIQDDSFIKINNGFIDLTLNTIGYGDNKIFSPIKTVGFLYCSFVFESKNQNLNALPYIPARNEVR